MKGLVNGPNDFELAYTHKLQEIRVSLSLSHCTAMLASRIAVRYCVTSSFEEPHRSGVRFEYEVELEA